MTDFLTHEEATQLLQGGCPELEASYQFTKNQIAELEWLRTENTQLRSSYDAACMLVAQLHEAVMGKVVGPHHGVVEDVRNKVAEQAERINELNRIVRKSCDDTVVQSAVIEKLRGALVHVQPTLLNDMYKEEASYGKNFSGNRADKARENIAKVRKVLSIPTDSKQILAEWLDTQLGEPVAWMLEDGGDREYNAIDAFSCGQTWGIPLFKKPELK
jgi:hypothetical protein